MRIVAGSHRGRRLQVPPGDAVRPTADRAREALFNILAHAAWAEEPVLDGARVLDAFCGSGALGLEALSRGAASCVFMDASPAVLECTRQNVATLDEEDRATLLRADALKPPPARTPCTLAFLDPPYGKDCVAPALTALAAAGWFANGAVVVAESDHRDLIETPGGFEVLDERGYGHTRLSIWRHRK